MKYFSDEELVRLYVATGSLTYFDALYKRYYQKVYTQCLSFSENTSEAQDFTQEVFLKLVTKLSSFREEAKFANWLYSITFNYCADQQRLKKQLQVLFVDYYRTSLELPSDEESVEQEMLAAERTIQQLPQAEQSLLLMRYQENRSIRDIALLNGLTENAVKMRLKRLRDRLRQTYLQSASNFM